MTTPNAGRLGARVRSWLSSYNTEKLLQEDIFDLMNEAGNNLVKLFDIWFLKGWGTAIRSSTNAIWDTIAIPEPTAADGSPLTASQIEGGSVPENAEYLRAMPFPDRLLRPYRAYYGSVSRNNELAFLMEDEYEQEYDFESTGNTPEAYATSGKSILLGKPPGFAVTLIVQGFYEAVALEDDDDENEFTRNAHELLVYSTQNLIIKYNYEEETRANLFAKEYDDALRAVLAQGGRISDVARQSRFQRKG